MIKQGCQLVGVIILIMMPLLVSAQGLTLTPSPSGLSTDYKTIALITLRMILVLAAVITGMVALKSGHNWIFSEGNAKKAHENKRSLAAALLIITILFFLMLMFRVFIPDYSALTI